MTFNENHVLLFTKRDDKFSLGRQNCNRPINLGSVIRLNNLINWTIWEMIYK